MGLRLAVMWRGAKYGFMSAGDRLTSSSRDGAHNCTHVFVAVRHFFQCVCVCVCTRGEDNTCQCVGTFVMHQVAHWDAVSLKKQQVLPFLETRPELQVATLPTHGLTQI